MPVPFAAKDLSYSQRRDLVSGKLREKVGSGTYLSEIYDGYVVYTVYNDTTGYRDTTYRVTYSIGSDYAVEFGDPEEVVATTKYETVAKMAAFAVPAAAAFAQDGRNVYTGAKLFRTGQYPDKGVPSVTTADLQTIVARFQPGAAPIDYEHDMDSATAQRLRGQFGGVERVWVDPTGEWLCGDVAIADWFDAMLSPEERQLSVYLDPSTWDLKGCALTETPRVQGAALMAAFSAATTPTTPAAAAPPSPARKDPALKKVPFANLMGPIVALFTGAGIEIEGAPAPTAPAPAPDATTATTDARFSALQAEVQELRAGRIESAAAQFADGLAARILPTERDAVIRAYKRAAEDDAALPKAVKFSRADGTEATGTRVDELRALYEARPEHGLTAELVASNPTDAVLFAAAKTTPDAAAVPFSTNDVYERRRKQTAAAARGQSLDD